MKFLVIGLGSMGKRRIRCLKSLGYDDITGYDPREDRRLETQKLYQVKTLDKLHNSVCSRFDVHIISVPPDCHLEYMKTAVDLGIPAFVEASVLLDGLEELDSMAKSRKVLIAPSCTLRFHPAVKIIKKLIKSEQYGKFTNFSYHSGQYLPDWHPWEKVTEYYVSNPSTGGAREIVPFELTWIVDLIGFPAEVTGLFGRTMDVGAEITDTYAVALKFSQGFGTMLVDVVARHATRNLILNMEKGQIAWRWDDPHVKVFDAASGEWVLFAYQVSPGYDGYNKNIIEEMYIEELGSFIGAVNGREIYPNTLADDIAVLKQLIQAETSNPPRLEK
ncbi:MAG: gfo/Idh/MocA family oxidoreductase [Proteobacteria bacterium]|nr:gfo/Idh/MocA family oxidoreductase [Pseudomonadota bacterium]MBU1688667.1 gfo/Idh/MocA family oxidoreductase [Pseudomonadota bacterium]